MRWFRPHRYVLMLYLLSFGLAFPGAAQDKAANEPLHHFRIEKPGRLDLTDAQMVYKRIKLKMTKGYALSGNRFARYYKRWRRFNSTPYLSATHGNRYVNNYGNAIARGYGNLKAGGRLPPGAVLAKDSFTVTRKRGVFAGALFIMEKLAVGRSPSTGDWRYLQIMPDGSIFGDSTGDAAAKMGFCHSCHRGAQKTDFLFNVPAKFKREINN